MGRIFFYSVGLLLSSQLSYTQPEESKKKRLLGWSSTENKSKKDGDQSRYNQDRLCRDKQHDHMRKQAVLNVVLNIQYLPEQDEYTTDISYRKSSRSYQAPALDSFSFLQYLCNSQQTTSFKSEQKPALHHCIYKDVLDKQMSDHYSCKPKSKNE